MTGMTKDYIVYYIVFGYDKFHIYQNTTQSKKKKHVFYFFYKSTRSTYNCIRFDVQAKKNIKYMLQINHL